MASGSNYVEQVWSTELRTRAGVIPYSIKLQRFGLGNLMTFCSCGCASEEYKLLVNGQEVENRVSKDLCSPLINARPACEWQDRGNKFQLWYDRLTPAYLNGGGKQRGSCSHPGSFVLFVNGAETQSGDDLQTYWTRRADRAISRSLGVSFFSLVLLILSIVALFEINKAYAGDMLGQLLCIICIMFTSILFLTGIVYFFMARSLKQRCRELMETFTTLEEIDHVATSQPESHTNISAQKQVSQEEMQINDDFGFLDERKYRSMTNSTVNTMRSKGQFV